MGDERGNGIRQMGYGRESEEVEKGARGEWDEKEPRQMRVALATIPDDRDTHRFLPSLQLIGGVYKYIRLCRWNQRESNTSSCSIGHVHERDARAEVRSQIGCRMGVHR